MCLNTDNARASENKHKGNLNPNYHYTLEGILTAANSGKLVRQHEELGQHGKP